MGIPTTAGRDIKRAVSLLSRLTDFSPWLRTETRIVIARALVRLDDVPAARRQIADASRELRLTPDAPLLAQWLAKAQKEADAATMSGRSPLTKMELRVLQYLPGHLSFPGIAEELFLSLNTVKTHVRAIYHEAGRLVSSRSGYSRSGGRAARRGWRSIATLARALALPFGYGFGALPI